MARIEPVRRGVAAIDDSTSASYYLYPAITKLAVSGPITFSMNCKLMSQRFLVAKCGDIPQGQGRSFEVNDRIVAVFHIDDKFYSIDDACPHMGASLSVGELDGCVVTCPLHAWRFDVRDGTWCDNPRVSTDSFPLTVEGDDIYIEMDE